MIALNAGLELSQSGISSMIHFPSLRFADSG
jgi:hypothetical protein